MRISDWSSTCALPISVGEARRGDLGHGYRADAARPERGIEAATLQVGGDHLGDLPAQAVGAQAGDGGDRRRRESGHRDDGAFLRQLPLDRFARLGLDDGRCGRRSDDHTSDLQSLMRQAYAVSLLKTHTLYDNIQIT